MPFCPIKHITVPPSLRLWRINFKGVNKQVTRPLCRNWFRNQRLQKVILPILFLLAVIPISRVCAAPGNQAAAPADQDLNQPIRVRIFALRNITTQEAKAYLQSAKIADTVLAIPGTTAISITGSSEQLVYAATFIRLVDSNEKYDVRFIDVEPDKAAPDTGKIEKQLGQGYSIGSLLEGPEKDATVKAIVCSFKGKLLVVAPKEQAKKIIEVVKTILTSDSAKATTDKEKQAGTEPNQQSLKQSDSTSSPQAVFTK